MNKKATALPQMETPEFKAWFGDSKVTNENGEPLVVYHSTDNMFTVFDKDQLGTYTQKNTNWEPAVESAKLGFWFNSNKLSKQLVVDIDMPCYLKMESPRYIQDVNQLWYALNNVSASQFIEESISLGHDGIIIEKDNEFGGMSYIVFSSNQIKSAIDNKGTFDPHNPDITASKTSTASIRILLCTTATTLKGWITPDGEFVHIGDKNHYEYIGELLKEAIDAAGISATGSYSDFAMSRGWIRTTGGYEDTLIVELNDSATAKGIQTAISYIKDAFNSEALVYIYINNVEHKISDKSELASVLQKLNKMAGVEIESSAIATTQTVMAALEYKHGCIEIHVPAYIRSYFLKEILAERLSVEDLNQDESVFGVEPDTHITALFGIDDQDRAVAELKKLFTKPLHIKTSDVEYFDNNDSSVAYVSLECLELTELHYALAKNLEVKDTHPEYVPHITLAYINKGKRLKDDKVKPFEWDCNTLVVSSKDGHLVSVCCTPDLNGNVLVQELVDPTAKQ
jgi:hypothetical protein